MRVLSCDPALRVLQRFRYDHTDDTFVVEKVQDVEDILEYNKTSYAYHNHKANRQWYSDSLHKVASIPQVVIDHYRARGIDLMTDDEALRRFLNDPDNRLFRTRPGRV